jgi:NAD(P)H-dependent flavin oxidoreductase YrpB (nitropropane dioxygenase family)
MLRDGLAMRRNRKLSWSQVIMAANTPMLLREGLVNGNPEAGVLAAGQVVGAITDLPTCADLVETIVTEATTTLTSLATEALTPREADHS